MEGKTNQLEPGQALHDLFREGFALQGALTAIMDRVHQQAGLNTSQHKIMHALTRGGPATVPDVADRLGVSRQVMPQRFPKHCHQHENQPRIRRNS